MSKRCLCLNVTYEPLGFLSQDRAVVTILNKTADLVESGSGVYRSPGGITIPEPLVVRLNRFIKVPRTLKEAISPRALFARDNFTCQYCGTHQRDLKGKKNRLTIDHIKPRGQGGPHHWENIVTACYPCNLKKGNRTPQQANLHFVAKYKDRAPKKPHLLVFTYGGKIDEKQAFWIKQYYGVNGLDEEIEWDYNKDPDDK